VTFKALKAKLYAESRAPKLSDGMSVTVAADGSVTIHATGQDAALLAGRTQFGDLSALQAELRDLIADAWYDAGCPPAAARSAAA
jgi:hypothetical protein